MAEHETDEPMVEQEEEMECSQRRRDLTVTEQEELQAEREQERFEGCVTRTVELLLNARDELEGLGVTELKVTEKGAIVVTDTEKVPEVRSKGIRVVSARL